MTGSEVDVVVVEDDSTDAELTLRVLSRHTDRIVVLRDGQEALDLLFSTPSGTALPRAVLLDLKLPKVDGIEVLRKMKGDERTRTVPVIVMSSSGEPRDVAESYQLGANSYVVKPVDVDDFEQAITDVACYWLARNQRPA